MQTCRRYISASFDSRFQVPSVLFSNSLRLSPPKMAITVGVAGITGKFARRVVTHLQKHSDVSIRGFCRDPSKVPERISSSHKVTLFKEEAFDVEAVRAFAQGCDVLICCYLGDDKLMIDGQKILIDACEELGVPR